MDGGDAASSSLEADMEEDLITAAFGPLGRLLRRLHSFEASSGHRLPEGISADEIRLLTEGLEGLYNHLKDLPEADLGASFAPKWWIKEVRELAYDTEDYFDEVMQSGAGDGVVVRRSARLSSTISRITSKRKQSRPQIAQGFLELMARVVDARERCKSFHLAPETATEADSREAGVSGHTPELSLDLPVSAATISDVHVDNGGHRVVGLEEPMKKLVNLLGFGDMNQKQLKVVPILGLPGVGKTMVARILYHQYGGEFQCRAFIRVSRNPDMRTLLTGILSQIKAPPAHAFSDAQDLIDSVINHLQGKRYFIIVDDLWTASLWDIISRAFPYGDCRSRILTTTQIEDVALACSDYESEYVFKMGPLGDGESRKLFFSAVFGSEGEGGCPKEFEVVAHGIIRKCGGLPLSTVNIASLLLPSKPNLVMEKWGKVERSLPPTLRTDPTSQGMKDVLILIYNKLPLYLKTCLLYLAMYPEGHTIWKDDLLKQWFAESFARDTKHGYFEELVRTGLIQPVDTNYHGEVLSCTVNHMVLDLLRYKSMEDNFIVALNYFESTLGHPDKVRRLSIQFRGAKSAKIPESISVSQVRSLVFSGFCKCLPSILDWRLLRVLILHMWGDQDETSFDLTRVGELFQLRYLNIECDISVDLPDKIEGLKYLETLHVDAKLSAVPSDVGHLEKLLYLRLPSEVILPDGFACMTSLCTLGYFDLSRNSEDSVKNLGELKNLQDLQLTCCAVESFDNLENNKMKCLGLVLGKLRSLRCLTLVPASGSSNVNTDPQDGAGSLSMSISFDGLSSVSPAPVHLQRLEFSRHCCIFSRLPKWTGELSKLCILKIAVRMLSREDIETLKGLPALTALCLYIFQTSPTERIVFGKEGFSVLRYFKYRCSAPWLEFQADAMPNLQKLKLGFNTAMWAHHNSALFISIEHLPGLKEISVKIWGGAGAPVESILTTAIRSHPRNPKISGQLVNWNFGGEIQKESSDKNYRTQHVGAGEDDEIQVSRIPVQSMSSSPLPVSGSCNRLHNMALVPSVAAGSDALQVFASGVGLGDGVVALQEKVRDAGAVLGSAREIEIQNEALVQSLPQLQHLINDAEEVLDEIDYFRVQAGFNTDDEMLDEVDDCACEDDEVDRGSSSGSSDTCGGSNLVAPADVDKQGSTSAVVPAYERSVMQAAPRAELNSDELLPQICEISRSLGDFTGAIRDALKLEELDGISLAKHGSENTKRLTTPYLTVTRIFGRDHERDQIIKLLTSDAYRNQTLTVLPVVGHGGIGKTALAQYVFSDPRIETYFDMKIWICVSLNFDAVRLTRQMLECITGTDQRGSVDLNILQDTLKDALKGSRVLLVLDDIWDIKDSNEWSQLVAPLRSNQQGEGNAILATTRNQSVAKSVGALDSIALDGLESEAFWDCFRAYAFGKEKGHKKLHRIGRQIADRLKGYPLAAKSVGGLLRKDISVERWTRILESKEWISHQDTEGIIAILKFSYDYLPFHLRRCFSYCSLFPKSYQIYAEDLVYLWISQGFVYPASDNRRLEEIGSEYLDDLVNLGFFEKLDKDRTDIHFLMHDLMHDLAQGVSSKECFTMDGSQCQQMPPTIQHLSIIATSQYSDFEKDMVQLTSLQSNKLVSFMLFGSFGSTFVKNFHFMTDVTRNLRTLRLSGFEDDGDILSGFGHCIHLRYLRATKQENDKHNPWFERFDRQFPKELCALYRLQFLNVGVDCHLSNLTKSFSNLVNLRHFICHEESHSEISNVSKLTSLQELRQFMVRKKAGFWIAQLGNLLELGSLCIFGLENLESKEEANNARLLDREHLKSLCLSWDASRVSDNPDAIKEVLEGLQPHPDLNHLQISGYRSATPPTWLGEASPLIRLRSIYLEDCQLLRTLPPFVHLKCLKKLHLVRICGTTDMSTHSLEELIIEEVEELERWIVRDDLPLLASELHVLEIKGCPKLRELPLSCYSASQTVAIHVFPVLYSLIIHDCPLLMPLPPLPLGPKVLKMTTVNVGSALYESLSYYQFKSLSYYQTLILHGSNQLRTPNGVLAMHNLGTLYELTLINCSNLTWFSWAGAFWQLKSLKKLNFVVCPNLLSMPATQEEQDYMRDRPLLALETLTIESCCIRGNLFGHVLSLLPSLSYLEMSDCLGAADDKCMLLFSPGSLTSLKELYVTNCGEFYCGSSEGLGGLISLEKLRIGECPKLLSSLMPKEMEQDGGSLSRNILLPPSLQELVLDGVTHKFLSLSSLTCLKDLGITESSDLESLDLHSCTALEEIRIHGCGALSSVQGLQTCIHLRSVQIYSSPDFWSAWSLAMQELERVDHGLFCPQLERIWTDDLSLLTSCSCKFLTSLERLGFLCCEDDEATNSTMEDPNEVFLLLTSLIELEFNSYSKLHSLPATLHLLPSLKKLAIKSCESIESLEEIALPASLEELHISDCGSLQSLPARLNCLQSFRKLEILCCSGILSLQEQRLPPCLDEMVIDSCENLQYLPDDLHRLSSLSKLEIKSCPSIKSLPESGVPPALRDFWVWDCSEELQAQCNKIRNIKRVTQIYM